MTTIFALAAVLGLTPLAQAQHAHTPTKTPLAVNVAFDDHGRLWRAEVREGQIWLSVADAAGQSFKLPVRVNAVPENIAAEGENRPKLAFRGEQVYVSWTQSLAKPYTGHVRFARSPDGGKSFSEPITVNDNRDLISHRFDALLVDGAGRIHLTWLDKRDAKDKSYAGAALYHSVSEDGGVSFSANRLLAAHSCECCRVAMARDVDGVPLVLWRHVFDRNTRDHALLKLNGRSGLQRVSFDHWQVDACPHHGPALAVAADGARHLVWFNNAPERHGLFYARMTADGQMSTPQAFGDFDAQAAHPSVAAAGNRVVLAWKEFDGQRALVRVLASSDGGKTWGAPRRALDTAGASDHPLLISDGRKVLLSWNTAGEGHRLWLAD